jgi:hypothetical protein
LTIPFFLQLQVVPAVKQGGEMNDLTSTIIIVGILVTAAIILAILVTAAVINASLLPAPVIMTLLGAGLIALSFSGKRKIFRKN